MKKIILLLTVFLLSSCSLYWFNKDYRGCMNYCKIKGNYEVEEFFAGRCICKE